MKTLKSSIIILFIATSLLNGQDFPRYYMSIYHLPSYRSFLGLSIRFPRGGRTFLTRMCIVNDSTFQYDFGGDMFSDAAIGSLKETNNKISLTYLTPSFYIADSIIQTSTIKTDPPISVSYKTPLKWENPIAHIRPVEIRFKMNKLIILKTKEPTSVSNKKKNKLKKVLYSKWIKYGPIDAK